MEEEQRQTEVIKQRRGKKINEEKEDRSGREIRIIFLEEEVNKKGKYRVKSEITENLNQKEINFFNLKFL